MMSGIRESNPPPQLGKLMHYRCANAATKSAAKVLPFSNICNTPHDFCAQYSKYVWERRVRIVTTNSLLLKILRIIIQKSLHSLCDTAIVFAARGIRVPAAPEYLMGKHVHGSVSLTAQRNLYLGLAAVR